MVSSVANDHLHWPYRYRSLDIQKSVLSQSCVMPLWSSHRTRKPGLPFSWYWRGEGAREGLRRGERIRTIPLRSFYSQSCDGLEQIARSRLASCHGSAVEVDHHSSNSSLGGEYLTGQDCCFGVNGYVESACECDTSSCCNPTSTARFLPCHREMAAAAVAAAPATNSYGFQCQRSFYNEVNCLELGIHGFAHDVCPDRACPIQSQPLPPISEFSCDHMPRCSSDESSTVTPRHHSSKEQMSVCPQRGCDCAGSASASTHHQKMNGFRDHRNSSSSSAPASDRPTLARSCSLKDDEDEWDDVAKRWSFHRRRPQ